MSTATASAGTRTSCQVNAGTLVAPCPNQATDQAVVASRLRRVCRAHR